MIEVKLNGEIKQLKFGNYAVQKYGELTGSGIGEMKEVNSEYSQTDMVVDLVYSGLWGFYRSKEKVVDFEIKDVRDWVDDMEYSAQLEVIKAFHSAVLAITTDMLKMLKAMNAGGSEKKK